MKRLAPYWVSLLVVVLVVAVGLWVARPRPSVPAPAKDRAARIEEAAHQDAVAHRTLFLSLERELARVRLERQRLEAVLEQLGRALPALLLALGVMFAAVPSAEASEPPRGSLTADGRTCFSLTDTAALQGAYVLVPKQRLELDTLRQDRALASQEIGILQKMIDESRRAYEAERVRAGEWSELEGALRAQVQDLERVLHRSERRERLRLVGIVAGVLGGGLVLGWSLAR